MTEYSNTNKGAIWKNDKKESDKHPDFKGSIDVEGIEYWVSAWKRKPDGNPKAPALSFSIKRKDEVHNQGVSQAQAAVAGSQADDFDDDIPF